MIERLVWIFHTENDIVWNSREIKPFVISQSPSLPFDRFTTLHTEVVNPISVPSTFVNCIYPFKSPISIIQYIIFGRPCVLPVNPGIFWNVCVQVRNGSVY